VLGCADLVEQVVESFRCEFLTCGQRAKHVDQEQAHTKNLRQQRITHRRWPQLSQNYIAHLFTALNPHRFRHFVEHPSLFRG
jgi:hypothetical protein